MTVVFFNQITGNREIVDSVERFKISKINYRGRKMNCYILSLLYWSKTFPCKHYELLEVRKDG